MKKWFSIAFVGCKCRSMRNKEEGMERKKRNENERKRVGKGVENKLLRCGSDCNNISIIKLQGLFWTTC